MSTISRLLIHHPFSLSSTPSRLDPSRVIVTIVLYSWRPIKHVVVNPSEILDVLSNCDDNDRANVSSTPDRNAISAAPTDFRAGAIRLRSDGGRVDTVRAGRYRLQDRRHTADHQQGRPSLVASAEGQRGWLRGSYPLARAAGVAYRLHVYGEEQARTRWY